MSRVRSTLAGLEAQHVAELVAELRIHIPDPEPVTIESGPGDTMTVDPDPVTPEWFVELVAGIYEDAARTYPGPRSWRRWKLTRRVGSVLYGSGLTTCGTTSMGAGDDPVGGWVYQLPRWGNFWTRRHRPYVLWLPDWWWECHRRQGWRLWGHHRPREPFGLGVCAACLPCPSCGALYECADDCPQVLE